MSAMVIRQSNILFTFRSEIDFSLSVMNAARLFVALLFSDLPLVGFAGGNYVSGVVADFSEKEGAYAIRFVQTVQRTPLVPGCMEIQVTVAYERVPWYSWLPFFRSSHPTRAQTEQAANYLRVAYREARSAKFGYMGYGLHPANSKCTFLAKGLLMETEGTNTFVLAFHDPI